MRRPLIKYEEGRLRERLDELSGPRRTMFAAACAERLLPLLAAHDRTAAAWFRDTLDSVWRASSEPPGDAGLLQTLAAEALERIPDEDAARPISFAVAENAATATVYAVRTALSGDPQDAVWAARQAYDALDVVVVESRDIDINAVDAELEVLADELVQDELLRQQRDLETLGSESASDVKIAAALRARAREEGEYLRADVTRRRGV
jgi:Protein of unknown function (DUF416)